MSKGWDNATLKKLKALTGQGLSTSEIGKKLGMSKNAIVGKLNRLGWNLKAGGVDANGSVKKTVKKTKSETAAKKTLVKPKAKTKTVAKVADKAKKATAVSKKPKAVKKVEKQVKETVKTKKTKSPKNLAMHQRIIRHSLEMANLKPNQCRYPIGNPDTEDFHFCGEPVFVGKPYCYEHCKDAYQFSPPKKK